MKKWRYLIFLLLFLLSVSTVTADDGLIINPVPSNEAFGIADINTGLEISHDPSNGGGYLYLQSNYTQAQNVGIAWNRWAIRWDYVERIQGELTWSCNNCGTGERFDYLDLALADSQENIHSLVILTEIPSFYMPGGGGNQSGDLVEGITTPTFKTEFGFTDDPNSSGIIGINPANKWALFFDGATQTLGQFGVHHWQIMNEMNQPGFWSPQNGLNPLEGPMTYIRLLEITSKIITYREIPDKIIVGGLLYTYNSLPILPIFNDGQCPTPEPTSPILSDWTWLILCKLAIAIEEDNNFYIEAIALHGYGRSKTNYDYPTAIETYLNQLQPNTLADVSIWITESGSNGCPEEPIGFFTDPLYENCFLRLEPPTRNTAQEQAWYTIQNLAYSQARPVVERHFQFHLHDFCPHGQQPPYTDGYRPGFGLYRNWKGFDYFDPSLACAVVNPFSGNYDGAEKPAYQAFRQATTWLRNIESYPGNVGQDEWAEVLQFPAQGQNVSYVAWARGGSQVVLRLYPSFSGGPIQLVAPDGTKSTKYLSPQGYYKITLPAATDPFMAVEDGLPGIGGQPFIILEHVLLDLGPTPAIFRAGHQTGTIRFGLNLPQTGTPSPITFTIQDETGQVVKEATLPAPTGNGQYNLSWDGRDQTSNQLVADGLYTYQIALAIDTTPYQVSGVIGVSKPNQLLACFFNETYQDFPPSDPPSHLFRTFVTSSLLSEANFVMGPGFPPAGVNSSKWSVRLAAYLSLNGNASGVYRFKLLDVDDAARLFVDGVMVTSTDWVQQTGELQQTTGPGLYLNPGLHTVLVEYTQVAGTAGLNLIVEKRVDLSADQWQAIEPQWWLPGANFAATCRRENTIQQPPNGGFEEGLTAWTELSDPDLDSDWQLSTLAYTGLQSVQGVALSPSGLGGGAELISSPVAVEAGDCYRFSLYGRSSNNAGTDFGALAFVEWSTGASYGFDAAWPGQSEWERVERNLVAPAGATTVQLRFLLTGIDRATTNFDATIWLDQIKIESQDPANC